MKRTKIIRLLLAVVIIINSMWGLTLVSNAADNLNLQGVLLTPNTDTQVKLTWNPVPNTRFYAIYKNTRLIQTIDTEQVQDSLTYTVTGLTPQTAYTFVVQALRIDNSTIATGNNSCDITTGAMPSPAITGVVYDINRNIVGVSYVSNSLAAKNAKIAVSYTSTPPVTPVTNTAVIGNQISITLPSQPTNESDMNITLTTFDSLDNNGNPVHQSAAVTGTIKAISAPTLSVSMSNGTATVSWPGFDDYVKYFNLERSKFATNAWEAWQVVNSNILDKSASITDTPAQPGTYRYRLTAKAGGQYSGSSAVTQNAFVPGKPTGLSCSISSAGIVLRWTNNTNNSSPIEVRKSTDGTTYTTIAQLDPSSTTYTDGSGITTGSTYYYYVRALNDNNLVPADIISITVSNPSDPSNLKLTIISSSQVDLSWTDNVTNEQGFIIERKILDKDGNGVYTQIATVPANITSYSDKTVTPGNKYTYRVCAYNSLNNSGYTNEVSCKTTDLTTPNFLEIIQVSSSELDLKWSYPFQKEYTTVIEYSYIIGPSSGDLAPWITLATVPNTKYSHTGLNANTKYYYRIRAVSSIDSNVQSSIYPNNGGIGKGAYTFMNTPVISGITQPALNQATISWTDTNSGHTGYSIERKSDTENYGVVTVTAPDARSWTDKNLRQGVIYTYRIKAISANNSSEYSDAVSTDSKYTGAPSNLTLDINPDNTVKLTWTDNSSIEDEYQIWRLDSNSSTWYKWAVVAPDTTSYIDKISPNVTYTYMVRYHVNSTNTDSQFTFPVSTSIVQPAAPSYLSYSLYNNNASLVLTWGDMSNNEDGFKIERRTGYGGAWTQIASVSSGVTWYYDTNLAPNTQYFYRVKSFYIYPKDSKDPTKQKEYSAPSYEIEVNTGITSPVDLTFDAPASDTVKLKWECNAPNVAGYRIERRYASSGSAYTLLATVSKDTKSYVDQSTASNTQYVYRVGAYTATGVTSYSGEITLSTKSMKYYDDVGYGHWAWTAVQNLTSRGIIKGSNNKYYPANTITRAEFVSLLIRAFKIDKTPIGSFKDVSPDKWYYNDLMAAKAMGIISGSNNMFYPNKPITREDMAIIAAKTLKAVEKPLPGYSNDVLDIYPDSSMLSSYAKASMASLVGEKLISGINQNGIYLINPKSYLSRAETAVIIYKIIDR